MSLQLGRLGDHSLRFPTLKIVTITTTTMNMMMMMLMIRKNNNEDDDDGDRRINEDIYNLWHFQKIISILIIVLHVDCNDNSKR